MPHTACSLGMARPNRQHRCQMHAPLTRLVLRAADRCYAGQPLLSTTSTHGVVLLSTCGKSLIRLLVRLSSSNDSALPGISHTRSGRASKPHAARSRLPPLPSGRSSGSAASSPRASMSLRAWHGGAWQLRLWCAWHCCTDGGPLTQPGCFRTHNDPSKAAGRPGRR